jgi:PhnB protein
MNEHDEPPTSILGLAHGQLCYLQIPATDVPTSARFYERVFGWQVDPPESGFEAPSLIGQWITDRPATPDAGPVGWFLVADIRRTLSEAEQAGAALREGPTPDGPRWLASFSDPAGNLVGLAQHGPTPADRPGPDTLEPEVAPVPEHLHTVTPRLAVKNATAAIDFYTHAFDARELGERHCTPDGMLIHAELQIGDSVVMLTEDDGFTTLLCTYWPDVDSAWERALLAGAKVVHPLADQFYGERGGRLQDPFGQQWMLSTRLEKLTAAEIAARAPTRD